MIEDMKVFTELEETYTNKTKKFQIYRFPLEYDSKGNPIENKLETTHKSKQKGISDDQVQRNQFRSRNSKDKINARLSSE